MPYSSSSCRTLIELSRGVECLGIWPWRAKISTKPYKSMRRTWLFRSALRDPSQRGGVRTQQPPPLAQHCCWPGRLVPPWIGTSVSAVPQLTFNAPIRNMLDKARRNVRPAAPLGKLVAELTFGFSPFLISVQPHNLWSASSHNAFPHAHVPCSFLHTRLETIQRLRNRMAHHEPILSSTNEVYTGQLGHPKIALTLLECVCGVRLRLPTGLP